MAKPIQMPSLSPTMKEGKLTRWLKKEGDKVSSGQAIAEIETDKSNLEVEAYDDGILIAIVIKEGEMAPVGAPIAFIGEKGEKVDVAAAKASAGGASGSAEKAAGAQKDASKAAAPAKAAPGPSKPVAPVKAAAPARPAPSSQPQPQPQPQQKVVPIRRDDSGASRAESHDGGRLRASPLARKMAQTQGLDLGAVQGSGPHGRIIKRDIEAALQNGGAAAGASAPARKPSTALLPAPVVGRVEPESTPLSQMRRVIAQRMGEVKPGVPHFYLTVDVDMGAALALREQAKAVEAKVSVNDIIVKAVGVALRRYPAVNVSFQGDHMLKFANADVGVAVAIEDGLITPVVRDADQKGLSQISAEVKDFAERARKRTLKPAEYSGGAITVSNLGMYGMDEFIAVINPPQASILAVGAVADRVVARDGQPVVRKMMTATLSCDHRAIDGATGAEFLRELKGLLENPMRLLL